jgi:hypothetical protein
MNGFFSLVAWDLHRRTVRDFALVGYERTTVMGVTTT